MITLNIARAKAKDEPFTAIRSAHDLQSLYLDDVFRYVSAFVRPREEAEDVTMQVFHAAFPKLHTLKKDASPRIWLLGIARKKAIDSLRSHYRRREAPISDSPITGAAQVEQTIAIQQVLRSIPADQAEVLVLKYVSGLTTEEIATVLKRSPAAANSLIQRARQSFRENGAAHFGFSEEESR